MYNFNAKAELHRLEMNTPEHHGKTAPSPRLIAEGTVAECINKIMAKREPDRQIYSIAIGPDFGDAAAARQIHHQLVARRAHPAAGQQLRRNGHRGLALGHQMAGESQHVAQPLGQPAADRERKTGQP